jgi:DNA-binding CsgD family transcriptional regulator
MVADAIARRTQRLAPETIVVHDGEGEHLRIQTLPSGPLRQGLPGGALVSMRPILRRLRADVGESLSCLYGLTPAQARVAIAIAEGQTLNQYAAANGLTRETPKGQLAEVFNKTGVSRQAELVSLIWRISG